MKFKFGASNFTRKFIILLLFLGSLSSFIALGYINSYGPNIVTTGSADDILLEARLHDLEQYLIAVAVINLVVGAFHYSPYENMYVSVVLSILSLVSVCLSGAGIRPFTNLTQGVVIDDQPTFDRVRIFSAMGLILSLGFSITMLVIYSQQPAKIIGTAITKDIERRKRERDVDRKEKRAEKKADRKAERKNKKFNPIKTP